MNLGILAHVDAGKTTLTERLLHAAGVIDEVGRVDDGTTQTDSLALERQRGITIKSAVVSFVVDGVTINLIDTPGHPDFIAEVERVLGVLDGAVLVVSAVEGVQSQTLLLFRALRRLGVPTVVFVNKIDRVGADDRTGARRRRRPPRARRPRDGHAVGTSARSAPASVVHDFDDPAFAAAATEVLAGNDDDDPAPLPRRSSRSLADRLREALAEQTARLQVAAGVLRRRADRRRRRRPAATRSRGCCPRRDGDTAGPASGTVFKIERGPSGEKIAFVRMFAGTLRTRDRVAARRRAIGDDRHRHRGLRRGTTQPRSAAHGRRDRQGPRALGGPHRRHVRPVRPHGRATRVRPTDAGDGDRAARTSRTKRAVFDALTELAEQDPLINLRQDDTRQELFLSLYGEVQKEIVAQTLEGDYGLDIEFRPTTPVCIERPNRHRRGRRTAPAVGGRRPIRSSPRSGWRSHPCRPARA